MKLCIDYISIKRLLIITHFSTINELNLRFLEILLAGYHWLCRISSFVTSGAVARFSLYPTMEAYS